MDKYTSAFKESIQNKEQFWAKAAEDVKWIKNYDFKQIF